MALIDLKTGLYIPAITSMGTGATLFLLNHLLDGANEKSAVILKAPKAGTIAKVIWRTGLVTTGATVDVRLETVNVSGEPTGTLLGTNSNGAQVVGASDDDKQFTTVLTTGPTVAQGDLFAVVVANPGASFGDFEVARIEDWLERKFPYTNHFTGTWATNDGPSTFGLEYSDGTYANFATYPVDVLERPMFGNAATPDEKALRWKLPFAHRLIGFWVHADIEPGEPAFRLYDTNGTTVLEEVTLAMLQSHGVGNGTMILYFDKSHELLADTFYRMSYRSTVVAEVGVYEFTVGIAAMMDSFDGGQNFHFSSRTDFGSWTDNLLRRPVMGLIIDAISTNPQPVIKTAPGFAYAPRPPSTTDATPTYSSMLLDAASEKAAWIIQAPKVGNIRKVHFRTGAVTTGATVDVRLETVGTAAGDPTGTLAGTNTNGAQVIGDTDDNKWFVTTLTADLTIATKGDLIAVVIVNPVASFGDFNISRLSDFYDTAFPYTNHFTGTWSHNADSPVGALEYDDGTIELVPGMYPFKTIPGVNFDAATTPDELALKFKVPFQTRVTGAWFHLDRGDGGGSADWKVKLYDTDGTTVLSTLTMDGNQTLLGSNQGIMYVTFDNTVELQAGAFYRLALEGTGTNEATLTQIEVDSAVLMDGLEGGQDFHWSERTNAGAWTDIVTKRPLMGVILDGFSGGGGGLGVSAASRLGGGFQ